jgi:hypothetical protein
LDGIHEVFLFEDGSTAPPEVTPAAGAYNQGDRILQMFLARIKSFDENDSVATVPMTLPLVPPTQVEGTLLTAAARELVKPNLGSPPGAGHLVYQDVLADPSAPVTAPKNAQGFFTSVTPLEAMSFQIAWRAQGPGGIWWPVTNVRYQVQFDASGSLLYANWAAAHFPNPNAPNAAQTADPDGDGQTNEQEFLAGTNPNNPASRLSVTHLSRQPNGDLSVSFQTVPGNRYRLMLTNDLQAYTPQGIPITATEYTITLTVTPNASWKFLRLEVAPPP